MEGQTCPSTQWNFGTQLSLVTLIGSSLFGITGLVYFICNISSCSLALALLPFYAVFDEAMEGTVIFPLNPSGFFYPRLTAG